MKKIWCLIFAAMLMTAACGGGSTTPADDGDDGDDGPTGTGLGGAQTVTGIVLAPNGDPIPGATVSVPTSAVSSLSKANRAHLFKLAAGDGTECSDPTEESCASTCSGASGLFTLDVSDCETDAAQMVIEKGALYRVLGLSCEEDASECELTAEDTTFGSDTGTTTYPKVAVVLGSWDRMQDVLAKLAPDAYGTPNAYGQLEVGEENTENLTFIFRNNTDTITEGYDSFDEYLDGTKSLDGFDIVFINCGGQVVGEASESDHVEAMLVDDDVKGLLSDYVSNGGALYVTDLSYDFVEQVFPEFMEYENDDSETHLGGINDAQVGTSGDYLDATVHDDTLSAWLESVEVNAAVGGESPGNPGVSADCYNVDGEGSHQTVTGALNEDGTVPVGDFLSNWARMINIHDDDTKVWISSGDVELDMLENRPLTASRVVGEGRVFYSSYHTADECPTPNFWPQERVLQYLVFEAF